MKKIGLIGGMGPESTLDYYTNTPHMFFDQLKENSPIPLISIVEATCDEVGLMR